jgi:outer membrane lipoprotein-sorting protein
MLLAVLAALAVPPHAALPAPAPYPDGRALLSAMYQRYAGKWYRTLTFVQKTTFPEQNRVETWYEAVRVPGRLRIDISPIDSGRAMIFRNDSLVVYSKGIVSHTQPLVHPLMVLGFDVYAQDPEVTAAKLAFLGIALDRIREDVWQGRPVWVVGAAAGDTATAQFWIDQQRLVFVRLIQPSPGGLSETQFNRYQALGRGWVSVEVLFTVGGKLKQKEEYSDLKANPSLPDALFDGKAYRRPAWMGART